jgi:hypothetical protein
LLEHALLWLKSTSKTALASGEGPVMDQDFITIKSYKTKVALQKVVLQKLL